MSFYKTENHWSSTVGRTDFVNHYGTWSSVDGFCRCRLISLHPFIDYMVLPQIILQDGDSLRLFTVKGLEVANAFRLML